MLKETVLRRCYASAQGRNKHDSAFNIGLLGLRAWTLVLIIAMFRLIMDYLSNPAFELLELVCANEIDSSVASDPGKS